MKRRVELRATRTDSGTLSARPGRMPSVRRILLVEANNAARRRLAAAGASLASVDSHSSFETARARLLSTSFDFLVANVRLGAYNGLHLVYLGSTGQDAPRAIAYSDDLDPGLAREVQRAGAFYETGACLPVTLAGYLKGALPESDRRTPGTFDRRRRFRGGRRCWDLHLGRLAD